MELKPSPEVLTWKAQRDRRKEAINRTIKLCRLITEQFNDLPAEAQAVFASDIAEDNEISHEAAEISLVANSLRETITSW